MSLLTEVSFDRLMFVFVDVVEITEHFVPEFVSDLVDGIWESPVEIDQMRSNEGRKELSQGLTRAAIWKNLCMH